MPSPPLLPLKGISGVLRDFRTAAIEHIKRTVPEFREVGASGGILSEMALKRYSLRVPCARIAVLGMSNIERQASGMMRGPAHCIAYVIAEDEPPLESWDVAMVLAEKVMVAIDGQHTGYSGAGIGQVQEFQNMFSMDGERTGAALMGVAWNQDILFGTDYDTLSDEEWIKDARLGDLNVDKLKAAILSGGSIDAAGVDALINYRGKQHRDEVS
jgi:hypothetical protein